MSTSSPALRHRAAIVAWALRRVGLVRSWRQCVTAGLCVAASVSRDSSVEAVAEETMARLVADGALEIAGGLSAEQAARAVAYAWTEQRRLERAVGSARIGVPERALIDATRGASRPTWEDLARMSLVRPRRGSHVVHIDRRDYAAQVEAFVVETAPQPSAIGPLMGWDGEP